MPTGEDIDRATQLAEDYFTLINMSKLAPVVVVTVNPAQSTSCHCMEHFRIRCRLAFSKSQRVGVAFASFLLIPTLPSAATSVSVPRLRYVINSVLVKLPYFDPVAGIDVSVCYTVVGPISQACKRRQCRAGRVCATLKTATKVAMADYFLERFQAHLE